MIQNIIALIIVIAAVVITLYSLYKSVTVKDKTICGGCPSCELKSELKKKGKLVAYSENISHRNDKFTTENLRYTLKD